MTPVFETGTKRWTAAGILAALLVLLTGCAGNLPKEEQAVLDRAQARWDAVTAGDLETAYTYYSPGYRSTTSLIDYGVSMRMQRVRWVSAEYVDHSCEESRCTVRFKIGYQVVTPVPGLRVWNSSSMVEDTWVKTRGEWWYLPEK